jgi:hypothetical protein
VREGLNSGGQPATFGVWVSPGKRSLRPFTPTFTHRGHQVIIVYLPQFLGIDFERIVSEHHPGVRFVQLKQPTRGAAETVLFGLKVRLPQNEAPPREGRATRWCTGIVLVCERLCDRKWSLHDRQRTHARGVRVALLGTGLKPCRGESVGVAKRPRERISHPKRLTSRFATLTSL